MSNDPAYDHSVDLVVPSDTRRVLLLGATGTIGRAVLKTLLEAGFDVTCALRSPSSSKAESDHPGLTLQVGDLTSDGFLHDISDGVDAVVSCLASRTGAPSDAWAVDHGINSRLLTACRALGNPHFVLLSAICVQKPKLAFQHAKLAFEEELVASGLTYSIVRPTAFFKSLSGQLGRLRAGKPFLVFGDGAHTACKPISDADLARFVVRCLTHPACQNRILPVGGPGPALTPIEQGNLLFQALNEKPQFRRVPVALMSAIIWLLTAVGMFSPAARTKAELARIGRYYATESMLLWDADRQGYDADATPEFGQDTLADHYHGLTRGEVEVDLGEHAVF
ncbi:NAD(P)H-binding protein [Roseovarius rhodophyticola]|uniref:Divinyl chlorophyllide a 8-vinyl-reductase, chloroplastic n=1 Tax=Roseovarius rhodophyticola TaxID=3080827 RepID=A0ABZ2TB42_9RHOB|nr:NAD(P)H-binding protein [Roseovarius sp. W115]MDV2930608.1 NAD(P)H-binding protein [Roseovarius sp. W115]